MQSRRDKEKRMREAESATIVEERGIFQGIGIAQQKERNEENAEGMVILLCVVRERVIVMGPGVKQVSDAGITMLILWVIKRYLIMKRTVLLHSR